MSIENVRLILEEKLESEWKNQTDIFWDNVDKKPTRGTPFIRPTIEGILSEIISSTCQKEIYIFTVQVFSKYGDGSSENFSFADQISAMFFGFAEGNLICKQSFVERIGQEEEWFHCNVLVDVEYYNYY